MIRDTENSDNTNNNLRKSDSANDRLGYIEAIRKYGIKISVQYVFDCVFFDVYHKIDTYTRIYNKDFKAELQNIESGNAYMPSWTSEIKRSFAFMFSIVNDIGEYTFIDIGCGKGKVALVWHLLLRKNKTDQTVFGIDYYEPLVKIAKKNHKKLFGDKGRFICADATDVNYENFGDRLIVYLFNPFDEAILRKVLSKITNKEIYIIYNNPVHSNVIHNAGYHLIYDHNGGCPGLQTNIFSKSIKRT